MSDNIECRAFRTCFKELVGGISNPNLLAVSLYSENIISDSTRDEVTSTSLVIPDRALKLVTAVERQIKVNSKVFHSFVDALREDSSQVYLADFLASTYRLSRKRKIEDEPQGDDSDIPGTNWKLTAQFSVALNTIKRLLAHLDRCELVGFLDFLSHPLKPDKPYIQSDYYKSAATTSDIIQSLFPKFINYQNTGLLEQIVHTFGCDKCEEALQEYQQYYSNFTDKKLCNMPNAVSEEELVQVKGVKRLSIETSMSLVDATVADTEKVQNALEQATGIGSGFMSPAQHDEGSLILTFLVPESISDIFCELCEEDLEILANCGITRLQIEDCAVENIHEYHTNADGKIEQLLCIDHPDITDKGINLALLLKKVVQCTQYAHLVNLLAGVPHENMQKECSSNLLRQLAPTIGSWTELAPYLGITKSEVQQITMQYHSVEEQTYQALLQWKQLYQDSATHEGLVEFLVHHAPLSTVEAALNHISQPKLVQKARHVLQKAYRVQERGCLWHKAPQMMKFSQRLGRRLNYSQRQGRHSSNQSDTDLLALDYSSHIENFPSEVEDVSVKSFLNAVSQKKQRVFQLKGPHGSGKTVLLRRACSLWSRGLCWRKFTLVLWVDVKALAIALARDPQYSFIKFLRYVVPKGVELRGFHDWVHMHEGQDTLLVLDGIDPFTNSECKHFLDAILSGQWMRKGFVIATSSSPDQQSQYYLLGLSEDQITRQVISYYSDSPQKAEDFLIFISAAPAIKALCSNPPCLAAVLSVFDSGYPSDLPATWTQLFTQFVHLFIRQCRTLNEPALDQPILQQLAQWMHHGGVLPEPLRPFFNAVAAPYTIPVKPAMTYPNFSLPWLTSSYLHALHIHTLPLEEQAALMRSQRVGKYVWQFFAGLCSSVNTLESVLTNYCGQDTIKRATCAREATNIGSHKVEMQELRVAGTAMTAYVVLSVAQNSSRPCRVTVGAGFLEAGAVAEIGKCLTAASILGTGGIGELRISGACMPLQRLQEVKALARGVAVSSTLRTLDLRETELSAEGASELASALCVNHSLKELDLSRNMIPDAEVSALAGALRVNQSLEKLNLGKTDLSAEGASELASALCVNHSLKELDLSGNRIPDAGVSALAGALRVNQNLEKLDLSDTDLSAEGASELASALCVNHSLKELDLSGNRIPDAGVSALAGALRVNQNLKKLDLSGNGLSAEGATELASALRVNHSLKELNLSGNRIPDAGVSALAGALRVNQSLEKLGLSSTDLSAEGATELATALCVNHSLKELDLSWNRIPDAGVSALAGALRVNQSLEKLGLLECGVSGRIQGVLRDIAKTKQIDIRVL